MVCDPYKEALRSRSYFPPITATPSTDEKWGGERAEHNVVYDTTVADVERDPLSGSGTRLPRETPACVAGADGDTLVPGVICPRHPSLRLIARYATKPRVPLERSTAPFATGARHDCACRYDGTGRVYSVERSAFELVVFHSVGLRNQGRPLTTTSPRRKRM